jgi:hypothetical protein
MFHRPSNSTVATAARANLDRPSRYAY